jgi:hypothetical protein
VVSVGGLDVKEGRREIGGIEDGSGDAVEVSAKIVAKAVILSIKVSTYCSK